MGAWAERLYGGGEGGSCKGRHGEGREGEAEVRRAKARGGTARGGKEGAAPPRLVARVYETNTVETLNQPFKSYLPPQKAFLSHILVQQA